MSLNWNLSKIENHEQLCWVGEGEKVTMSPVTESLIFATMGVGMGEITASNWPEFWTRCCMWDRTHGFDRRFTREEVKAHIGLTTNATPMSKAAFHGMLIRNLRQSVFFAFE